jgi:uracil DNA glycosylase
MRQVGQEICATLVFIMLREEGNEHTIILWGTKSSIVPKFPKMKEIICNSSHVRPLCLYIFMGVKSHRL